MNRTIIVSPLLFIIGLTLAAGPAADPVRGILCTGMSSGRHLSWSFRPRAYHSASQGPGNHRALSSIRESSPPAAQTPRDMRLTSDEGLCSSAASTTSSMSTPRHGQSHYSWSRRGYDVVNHWGDAPLQHGRRLLQGHSADEDRVQWRTRSMGSSVAILLYRSRQQRCAWRHVRENHADGQLVPLRKCPAGDGLWLWTSRSIHSQGQYAVLPDTHPIAVLRPSRSGHAGLVEVTNKRRSAENAYGEHQARKRTR